MGCQPRLKILKISKRLTIAVARVSRAAANRRLAVAADAVVGGAVDDLRGVVVDEAAVLACVDIERGRPTRLPEELVRLSLTDPAAPEQA